MNNGYPPTALETKDCPPPLWDIIFVDVSESPKHDYHEIGTCKKCPAVKDFTKKLRRQPLYTRVSRVIREKCRKGGRKRKVVW